MLDSLPADRLLEGLAAFLCRALTAINLTTQHHLIHAASIEVNSLRYLEARSSLARRASRIDQWIVHLDTTSVPGPASSQVADPGATRRGDETIRIGLRARLPGQTEPSDEPFVLPIPSSIGQHAWLSLHTASPMDGMASEALRIVSDWIGHWLWRYQCAWAWSSRHGQLKPIIGRGEAMRRLDRCIAVAAQSDLPAHIIGPVGSPIEPIAHAIHDSSPRWAAPLIEADVPTLLANSVRLRSMMLRALQGSLIVRHPSAVAADELPGVFQRLLAALPPTLEPAAIPRLILIDERERHTDDADAALARATAPFGGLLRVVAPPLAERGDDLDVLLAHLCDRFQIAESRFSADARAALRDALGLPGDQLGFERLIARLAMTDPSQSIDESIVRSVIDRHAQAARARPIEQTGPLSVHVAIEPKAVRAERSWPPDERIGDDQLAADMLDGNLDASLHEAIRRAIAWAVANHASDISTPDAAEAACVSSSHLAHLLKAELGTSFRLLLARLRIERARRLLVEKPTRSVTDIALDVGFGDLSHFIKSFNRFTGATPREYRRRALAFAHWRSKQTPSQG